MGGEGEGGPAEDRQVETTCLRNLRAELYLLRVEPLLLARLFVAGVECQGVHGGSSKYSNENFEGRSGEGFHVNSS